MSSSIHNADVQLNSHDCGVWTCYALYHRALQSAIHQEPADIFKDMNMKTPQDAKLFRSCQHTGCSLLLSRLPCHCGPMAHLSGRLCPMMSILVPGEQMPFADLDSLVFSPPCSNAGCGCSSACKLIHTTTPTSWSAVTETHVNLRTKFTVSRSLWDHQPQDYTAEAWHAAVLRDTPALFKIPNFSPRLHEIRPQRLRPF